MLAKIPRISVRTKGYVDPVVAVTLPQVIDDGVFADARQQHHVVDSRALDIVRLPVVHLGEQDRSRSEVGLERNHKSVVCASADSDKVKDVNMRDVRRLAFSG